MKKSLLIIALLFASFAAFTDDGGSYKPEDWTYGNVYVKEPNDKIAGDGEHTNFSYQNEDGSSFRKAITA